MPVLDVALPFMVYLAGNVALRQLLPHTRGTTCQEMVQAAASGVRHIMPIVKGCNLPDNLLYDVENHIWFEEQADGTVKLGMTTVATAMAGQLVAFQPRRVGRKVDAGKSCATVESGKWVGPAKSAAGGEVMKINDDLVANPQLANQDPYAQGWFVILKPDDWTAVKPTLVPGGAVAPQYEAKMLADGFNGCP